MLQLLIEVDLFESSETIMAHTDKSKVIMLATGIPLYHYLIYPIFYNYVPMMPKGI